jgi:hypothetical protein
MKENKINSLLTGKLYLNNPDAVSLDQIEAANKYFNFTDVEFTEHHLCLFRKYLNNDKLFKYYMDFYSDSSIHAIKKENKKYCETCVYNCNKIDSTFSFLCLQFVVQVNTRKDVLDEKDLQNLSLKFLQKVYKKDGYVENNLNEISKLFFVYDSIEMEKDFLNNSNTTNLVNLYEQQNQIEVIKLQLSCEEDFVTSSLKIYSKFIKKKIQFYEKKVKVEKEISKKQNNKCRKEEKVAIDISIKKTKNTLILDKLNEYGFSKLETLKNIEIDEITNHIFNNSKPYQIAYLEFLGFIKKLENDYCNSQNELHVLLAKLIGYTERAVRGNINGIKNSKSTDRDRYTAHIHIENIKKHYEMIK